jgi:small basic protein
MTFIMEKKMTKSKQTRERGLWLSIWLILIMLHSIVAAVIIYVTANQPDAPDTFPWYISALVLAVIAKLIGAIAIWNWRKWGLYLYAAGVFVSIVVGLMLTGLLSFVFVYFLPLAVLGWLLKDKYGNFQ